MCIRGIASQKSQLSGWGLGVMIWPEDCHDYRENRDRPGDYDGETGNSGTRITVELILRKLADGASESELLEDYPHLTTKYIRAAVAYGAASVAHEEVVLLPNSPRAANPKA